MSKHNDQFKKDLHERIQRFQDSVKGVNSKIKTQAEHVEADVKQHLDEMNQRAKQNEAALAAAQTEINTWAEEQKTATHDKVEQWKAKHDQAKLQHRADRAARYAAASADVALAALDQAEKAAMEAWLAQRDAKRA
jgi:hypothetical protein